ncbi:DUF397 domain-containing protein [Streptomyces sp. NPDC001651]|uniref:DUF397 domain-containing protein n=1 Tax=Streptomyces sp. NPDC001651 TaxID=3364596 RepID=UPI00369F1243
MRTSLAVRSRSDMSTATGQVPAQVLSTANPAPRRTPPPTRSCPGTAGAPTPSARQGLHQDQPPPGLALVPVRDSKAADGPALCFEAASWAAFIGALKGQ